MHQSPISNDSIDRAAGWLQKCWHKHSDCKLAASPLPTRVIDVGGRNGVENPYLYISKAEKKSYVALSHCWCNHEAASKTITTTLATLERRIESIPLHDLPQTFQDAITITRRLGIQYLWIDSLCIIQDSHYDWEAEAANMGRIYQGSIFTLSALEARDSHCGFLPERWCDIDTNEIELYEYSKDPMYIRPIPPILSQVLSRAPLFQRAWALQERLLSVRILHFAKEQMYWECHKGLIQEDGMRTRRTQLSGPNFFKASTIDKKLQKWYATVHEYSKKGLTRKSDKLPALAGIAGKFQDSTNYNYLAGLWKEDLLRGLMWYTDPRLEETQSSDQVLLAMPSWSWAAVEGPINYQFPSETNDIQLDPNLRIIDATVTTVSSFSLGQVSGGKIRLCTLLNNCLYKPCAEKRVRSKHAALLRCQLVDETGVDYQAMRTNIYMEINRTVVRRCWCIRLATTDIGVAKGLVCVMLLEKLITDDGVYRRIGLGFISKAQDQVLFNECNKQVITIV